MEELSKKKKKGSLSATMEIFVHCITLCHLFQVGFDKNGGGVAKK